MKKILLGVLVVVVLAVLALFFGRNIVARTVVVKGIKQAAGLDINIASVAINLPSVSVKGLTIYNPAGFTDKVMAQIPEIALDIDLPGIFKNKIYFKKLTLDVGEVNVVLNEQGKLNVNSLALLLPPKGTGTPPEVKIDELVVKVTKVSYKGYIPVAGVQAREFNPGINETFRNVTDPSKVAVQIVQRIVAKVGVGSFATFAEKGEMGKAVEAVKKTVDDAAKGLKGLFNAK
jgi:hypothetical protein